MSKFPVFLRYQDLGSYGLTRHGFDRLINEGGYERVAPGSFMRPGVIDGTAAAWVAIAAKKPRSTLCMMSALSIHGLTDEIPIHSDIAIPRGQQPVKVEFEPVSWHRFDPITFDLGRTEYPLIDGATIGLYSAERTLVDLFRLRHRWGSDIAHSALKQWLRSPARSIPALLEIAQAFPKARPALTTALEILL
ncbi:hypothetical protein D9V34_07250 [Mycetocola lacteus]|uniref:Transcriptional regulator, AbiEi antitoxin, Type IV TA system n=1 Tax=Mycetocola lacteus TaxID=76637 RepID=A0A3L7ASF2_9MICO|nr:hypothetical protein [Mycetocola lacteus]RLP83367.1 hypothetical protein D9V34_07250 [Mycetocola lacteus]